MLLLIVKEYILLRGEPHRDCRDIVERPVVLLHAEHVDLHGRDVRIDEVAISGIGLCPSARAPLEQLRDDAIREAPQSRAPTVHEVDPTRNARVLLKERLQIAVHYAEPQGVFLVKVGERDENLLEHVPELDNGRVVLPISFVWSERELVQTPHDFPILATVLR